MIRNKLMGDTDPERAHQLATRAREGLVALGPEAGDTLPRIDAWLNEHGLS